MNKVLDIPSGYSKEDLRAFRRVASREFPRLTQIIEDYLSLAEFSDSDGTNKRVSKSTKTASTALEQMHLFDLLRDARVFRSNTELANFAARVLPNMHGYRFDKMSRGGIAARIIEYLETRTPKTRERLEASMRESLASPGKDSERKSFLTKWEKIIKGFEL